MMKVEFLKYNPEYVDQIAHCMFKEWGHLRGDTNADRYVQSVSNRVNDDKTPLTIIVKSEDGELAGFASLVDHDMETRQDLLPWLGGVFVLPEYRGKGIGKIIVSEIERVAGDLGFDKLYLFTLDKDKEEFYAHLSWAKLKDDYYLNSPVTIMSKEISSKSQNPAEK